MKTLIVHHESTDAYNVWQYDNHDLLLDHHRTQNKQEAETTAKNWQARHGGKIDRWRFKKKGI